MQRFDPQEIAGVIDRVRRRIPRQDSPAPTAVVSEPPASAPPTQSASWPDTPPKLGVFDSVDAAVTAARTAFEAYRDAGLERRHQVVDGIRKLMREQAARLGALAHEETGLGRAEDKRLKNLLVTNQTPGPEDLEPHTWTGDKGMTVVEYAPYGVIGSITPTTNPTATLINNTIAMVSAGNAVAFNVHPNARRVSALTIDLLNRAILEGGGPENLVTTVDPPTLDSARELMRHPKVRILLVTGGPGVVREALKSDKRAITAGPGNPPVVVDETADIELAAREIVRGASFDNNVICTDEKEVIAVASVADELLRRMEQNGARILKEHELRKLERVIFRQMGPGKGNKGKINAQWIGKDAGRILAEIGIQEGPELRLALADVPPEHPLIWTEQMMPIMPVTRVRDVGTAIDLAVKAEHGYGHTASIFSQRVDTITRFARRIDCSIFVANGPTLAGLGHGGEGYTSFSIASPTGEGLTRPRTFSRLRRIALAGSLRIV